MNGFIPSRLTDWTRDTTGVDISWYNESGSFSLGNGTLDNRWRRVGNCLEIWCYLEIGTTTSLGAAGGIIGLSLSVPSGIPGQDCQIDVGNANSWAGLTSQFLCLGEGHVHINGNNQWAMRIAYVNSVALRFVIPQSGGALGNINYLNAIYLKTNQPGTLTTSNEIWAHAMLPVKQWSST